MSPRGAAIPLTVIAGAVLLFACTEIPSGANDILSFQVERLASPGVIVGDSLRDSLGVVQPIRVKAFNFSGDEVEAPTVRFTAIDRGIRVDSITGVVVGDSVRAGARITATIGGLSNTVTIPVVQRPDTVVGSNDRDSLSYSVVDTAANVSSPLGVRVLTKTPVATDSAVASYVVSFRIVSPADTALARLVLDNGARSSLDTTDTSGAAGRRIKIDVTRLTSLVDSIIVQAFVKRKGVNVPGSPARLVLKVKPK